MSQTHRTQTGRRWAPPRPGARLTVFLAGKKLGTLEKRGPSRYRFSYLDEAVAAGEEGSAPLSISLPLQGGTFSPSRSAPFFEGLLPEGAVRDAIAERFRLSAEDGFGLLAALGADCAGAVVLLPEGERSDGGAEEGVRSLSEDELEALIDELPRRPLGIDVDPGDVRLSLGGVQDKLVLARLPSGEFGQPVGGAPSTCLLKPDYGRYEDLAVNEAFCMRAAAAAGLDVAVTELIQVGSTPCLLVERFDRALGEDRRVTRLHQEDMCQALGILPAAKYEANGGPSVARIVELLRGLRSARAAVDVNRFLRAVLVDFLLGNSDAHGKNFALLYDRATGVRLAPLYDLVSTLVYPQLTGRMAMSIGGVDEPTEVDLEAWRRLAVEAGLGGQLPALVRRWSADLLVGVQEARQAAVEEGWHRPVIDEIVGTCWDRIAQLGVRR